MSKEELETTDIRVMLQKSDEGSKQLDYLISAVLLSNFDKLEIKEEIHQEGIKFLLNMQATMPFSTSYDFTIPVLKALGIDWIMGEVNGYVGGTPFAHSGYIRDCYSGTPLLSVWLSVMRLILGDERPKEDQ